MTQTEKIAEKIKALQIKGFLADEEGMALFHCAREISTKGPILEVGSYCGLSTCYLGEAAKKTGNTLYALDHHRGSAEHQQGEEYHDPDLFDSRQQAMNSFPEFQNNVRAAEIEEVVVPLVASSESVLRHWATPLALVFVDGGHSHEAALRDCVQWSRHIVEGGYLAIHDIFEKPEDGGQGPYLGMKAVLEAKDFSLQKKVNSLVFLKRN